MSLNNRLGRLSALGRSEDALAAIDEALRLVLPILEHAHDFLPDAGLSLLQNYLKRCEEAERDFDGDTSRRMYAVLVSAGLMAESEE
jgi:hypothetical protein